MKNNRLLLLGLLVLTAYSANAQIGLGISAGYSRAFNETVLESSKNNMILGVKLEYYNSSIFQPMLDIDYSMIALNKSWVAQDSYQGVFNMRYMVFNVGLSSLIRLTQSETSESGFVPGFGISAFRNSRMVFDGTYNAISTSRGPRMNTDYRASEMTPFVSLSYLGQKEVYDNLAVQIQIGALYYVKNDAVRATYQYYDDFTNAYILEVNDKVKPLRPFFKVSAIWILGNKETIAD